MPLTPFGLHGALVVIDDDARATRFSGTRAELAAGAGRILGMGVVGVTDDASVHADFWERHPAGDEILYVLEGRVLAAVEGDGGAEEAVVEAGQAIVVPKGRWHRLRVLEPGRLLHVTTAPGSELRADTAPAA
jgi:mannose-6-phosphate isomerase-like protein (cupin superfamily)